MSLLSLNCRGLGNPQTVRELHALVKQEGPALVFLLETRLEVKNLDPLRIKLGFHGVVGVDRTGTGGGLALIWKEGWQVSVHSSSIAHIDAIIQCRGSLDWHLTGFYGNPESSKRDDSWTLLRRLKRYDNLPWLVIGDFNEITDASEKSGRLERNWYQMDRFRKVLTDCELKDMGFHGNRFTWWNGRQGRDYVYERLDRGVCSVEWRLQFPQARVRHVSFTNSDHEALALDFQIREPWTNKLPKRFYFENSWLQLEGCEEVIISAWKTPHLGYPMYQVCQKIKACRLALLTWSNSRAHPSRLRIDKARAVVNEMENMCQANPRDNILATNHHNARKDYNDLLAMEESYWKQRSRVSWLKEGDRNTRFFHASASQRKQKNEIQSLQDCHGHLVTRRDAMVQIVEDYFRGIYHTSSPSNIDQVV